MDNSQEMLAAASAAHPGTTWVDADANTWVSDQPVDVLYSNAALHWVDDHARTFEHLVAQLAAGGTIAAQMPANFEEPTHTTITDVVRSRRWSADLVGLLRPMPVHDPSWYHRLLSPLSESVDVLSTTYLQELSGDDPITTWCSGSALRPFLAALPDPEERREFLDAYGSSVASHYPRQPGGLTLLSFKRVFVIATTG